MLCVIRAIGQEISHGKPQGGMVEHEYWQCIHRVKKRPGGLSRQPEKRPWPSGCAKAAGGIIGARIAKPGRRADRLRGPDAGKEPRHPDVHGR
jgi:hypothetical protein